MDKTFIEQYQQKLYYFILKRVVDDQTANDILQEVLIKIYTKIDTLKEESSINKWIYQIARNQITDFFRAKKYDTLNEYNVAEEEEDKNEEHENASCLIPLIKGLPEIYKEVLMMHEINGLSQKQIAEQLSVSYSGIKSRVQRGRDLLKSNLKQCCNFKFDSYGNIIEYEQKKKNCERS